MDDQIDEFDWWRTNDIALDSIPAISDAYLAIQNVAGNRPLPSKLPLIERGQGRGLKKTIKYPDYMYTRYQFVWLDINLEANLQSGRMFWKTAYPIRLMFRSRQTDYFRYLADFR